MLLDHLKLNLPSRNRTTPQYYTCFGRVHVQTALQVIIIVTLAWDIFRWIDFIANRGVTFGWIEILAEICNALFGISLIIAYCFKSASLLLPYLFLQVFLQLILISFKPLPPLQEHDERIIFNNLVLIVLLLHLVLFTLVASMILFCVSILTVIWPKNSWASSFHTYPSTKASTTRLNALIYAISPVTFAIMLIWVIRVLFACYVHFSDQKKAQSSSPIVTVQNNGSVAGVTITSPIDRNSVPTTATTVACIPANSISPTTFLNPNFTLQDEDGEKQE